MLAEETNCTANFSKSGMPTLSAHTPSTLCNTEREEEKKERTKEEFKKKRRRKTKKDTERERERKVLLVYVSAH